MLRLADTTTRDDASTESAPQDPTFPSATGKKGAKFSWVPTLNRHTLERIKNHSKPLRLIGIVGRARTGKSFFLHTLVRKGVFGCVPRPDESDAVRQSRSFSVGSTTESHTKGILLLLYNDPESPYSLGLMDSEGLSDNYDKKIDEAITYFAFLISSTLIVNVEKTITTHDVSYLQEALLHRQMMAQNKISVPNLFWVIQFHSLKITEGLTPTEYLLSKISHSANNGVIKEGIQSLNHTIRTVIAAMSDEYWGRDLRQFSDDQLRPAYLQAMNEIVGELGDGTSANYRSGEEIASLIEGACDYFHDGLDTPIDRAIDLRIIAFSACVLTLLEKCFVHFKDALALRNLAHYDDMDVEGIRAELEKETSEMFFEQASEYDRKRFAETVYKELKARFTSEYNYQNSLRTAEIQKKCKHQLKDLWESNITNALFDPTDTLPEKNDKFEKKETEVFIQWCLVCNASHAFKHEHWAGDFYAIARTKSKEQLLGHFMQNCWFLHALRVLLLSAAGHILSGRIGFVATRAPSLSQYFLIPLALASLVVLTVLWQSDLMTKGLDGGSDSLVGWPFTSLLEWTNALLFNEALFTQYFFVYNHYYYRDKDISMLSLLILVQAMLKFLLDRLFRGTQEPDNVITEYGAIEKTKCATNAPKRTFLTFLVQLHSEKLFYQYIRKTDKWWYRWGCNYFRLYSAFARWFNPWSYFFFTRRVNNGNYNIYFYITSSESETRDPYLSCLDKSGIPGLLRLI